MKYLIFSLLFYSQYVRAQLPTEPVPLKDVRCAYGWIQCDDNGVPLSGKDKNDNLTDAVKKKEVAAQDINELKEDIKSKFGDEVIKNFEAKQAENVAFCVNDVVGEQKEKHLINYRIQGDKIIDVCSGETPVVAKSEEVKKSEEKVIENIPADKTQVRTAVVEKSKGCDKATMNRLYNEIGKKVIDTNRKWANEFVRLDCAGKEFNLGQVGSGIENNPVVKEALATCGYKSVTEWKYGGQRKDRKVCGDSKVVEPNHDITAHGAAIAICQNHPERVASTQAVVENGKVICYLKAAKKIGSVVPCNSQKNQHLVKDYCEWMDPKQSDLLYRQETEFLKKTTPKPIAHPTYSEPVLDKDE